MKTWFASFFKTFARLGLVCIGAGLAFDAVAGGASQTSASAGTPAALYQSFCSVCHGEHGNGQSRASASLNPRPSDFTHPTARASLSRERMIVSVREGRPGSAMIGWKTQLSDAQIAAVVDYVRDKFMDSSIKQSEGGGMTSPLPLAPSVANAQKDTKVLSPPLNGNRAAGRRLFEQNCVACHGKDGDGKGPRAYFIMPKPRSFVSTESRAAFSRPVLIHSIAHGKLGTEMPSWEKVLTEQEIANVAEYVFTQFIAPAGNIPKRERK